MCLSDCLVKMNKYICSELYTTISPVRARHRNNSETSLQMHDKSRENLETPLSISEKCLKLPQLPLMDEVTEAPSGKASHLLDISNPLEVFFCERLSFDLWETSRCCDQREKASHCCLVSFTRM